MNCNQAHDLLSPWIDDQLAPAERRDLERHLLKCAGCQTLAEEARALHEQLVRALAGPRSAANRAAQIVSLSLPRQALTNAVSFPARPRWMILALGMALGFLLAMLIFPPWKSYTDTVDLPPVPHGGPASASLEPATPTPAARLVAATGGEIAFAAHAGGDWQPVPQADLFRCPSDGSVRTGEHARCELMTEEGCVVRMNADTEIVFRSAAKIELKRGEIWCRSLPEKPVEVHPVLADADSAPPPPAAVPSFLCVSSDATCHLRVAESGDSVRITAGAGPIAVESRRERWQLQPHETATMTHAGIDRQQSPDRLLAASWMHPLLIRRGYADSELTERVEELLAAVGESKLRGLYESEIRSLGEFGVLPLLRYLESPRADESEAQRLTAMRIVADLAPTWTIGDLIGLLEHPDGNVRALAAAALARLTQETQGASDATWRGERTEWEPAHAAWQEWWVRNRRRFPTLDDATTTPAT
ncbi:MAG: zf-HC2 domain-containing protein [Planctomycetales bacterium]